MSVSLKKATNKTNIKHNNREMSEREKERNDHIDSSRSHENKYLVRQDLKELYQQEFGAALEKYNAKQKRADRKIDDYYKHIQSGKKTALQQEMVIQVGDKDDFSSKADFEKANEILEEWFSDFENRNPNLKVYNAVIHNDEASPHMHLNFVPVAEGYKRGLERQVSFDRAIKQQDKTLDQTRPFDDWRAKEVLQLENLLKGRGIERKLVGTNEYKDVNEYKEKKDLEREIKLLEKKLDEKKGELLAVSENVPEEKVNLKPKRKEIKTEVKPKLIGKPEVIEKETGNYVFSPKQLEKLENVVTAAVVVKKDYERLQKTDLVTENENLRNYIQGNLPLMEQMKNKIKELDSEKKELSQENRALKGHINDLKQEIGSLYQSTKEFLKERTDGLKAFKSVFKGFVDKVKDKVAGSEFERLYKREKARERDKGMEL